MSARRRRVRAHLAAAELSSAAAVALVGALLGMSPEAIITTIVGLAALSVPTGLLIWRGHKDRLREQGWEW